MQKIKNYRSADCVVGGFRYNEGKPVVGSLLLGLYDGDGLLITSASPRHQARGEAGADRKLEKLIAPPGFTGNAPGGPSRWSKERSRMAAAQAEARWSRSATTTSPAAVSARHAAAALAAGQAPRQCTMDQVQQKAADLTKLLK